MTLRAGFAETDITPAVGTRKIGWIKKLIAENVRDPLSARIGIFESNESCLGFVSLDTLSIRWTQVDEIRRRVEKQYGLPGSGVMVAATHNHAGPAVANLGDVQRDEKYVEDLTEKVVHGFGQALNSLEDAELAFGHDFEFEVSHNRRVVMRDGTVKTHGRFSNPLALCFEGPINPEVAVLAARDLDGNLLGCLVNFTCHPTHHGNGPDLSAGYPGALARSMKKQDCPVTVFLNGASGNIHDADPRTGRGRQPEEIGEILTRDVVDILGIVEWSTNFELNATSRTVQLPFREPTEDQIQGTVEGAQRFVDPEVYDRMMPRVLKRINKMGQQPAEVQVLRAGDTAWVGVPAEYFVQLGLRIKEDTWPDHTLIVGHANGMVGYVPHAEAFKRGGYETTFSNHSRLAPEAGDMLADCAVELVKKSGLSR
ncbi:MAG: hypothetical protein ACLFWL_15040 [Candidatus Brocadiia bacterium]